MGDRAATLAQACDRLDAHQAISVDARSSLYETAPQGEILEQADFLNAVVRIETALGPEDLLDVCKRIERDLGRESRQPRHSPRPVDLDVLLLGDLEVDSDRLTLPHRELTTRHFVLAPLLEIDPDATLPDGTRLDGALAQVAAQPVRRVGSFDAAAG